MTTHKVVVHEGAATEENITGAILEPRFEYKVLKPIFKNRRLYEIGDTIELTKSTARGFLELNEIEEINK